MVGYQLESKQGTPISEIIYHRQNQKEEECVDLCPTLDMIGNYFTKALQGSHFCRFRNIILGIHEDEITSYNASVIELLG